MTKGEVLAKIKIVLQSGDLPWFHRAKFVYVFHTLSQSSHGKAKVGRPESGTKTGWSIRDTARELNIPIGTVSEDIKLAKWLEEKQVKNMISRNMTLRLMRRLNII